MDLEYLLIDVFTQHPFGGSRLYLFPEGHKISPGLMQNLAHEFGVGETAFIVNQPEEELSQARLRVFTPSAEIPFGGHSVLGATFALDVVGQRSPAESEESYFWNLDAGRYEVSTRSDSAGAVYSLRLDPPVFLGQYFHRRKVAMTLGLDEDEIAITGLPCEVISAGLPVHIVPLGSLAAMESINLRRREADAIACDLGFGDLFVFTCDTVAEDATVHCRMFAPHFGIPEDPASGAATGALVAYLVKHRLVKMDHKVQIISEQGVEMGRPSRIFAEVEIADGKTRSIWVGGHCVLVGTGQIHIP